MLIQADLLDKDIHKFESQDLKLDQYQISYTFKTYTAMKQYLFSGPGYVRGKRPHPQWNAQTRAQQGPRAFKIHLKR